MREHLAFKHYLNFIFFCSAYNFILYFLWYYSRKNYHFLWKIKIKKEGRERKFSHNKFFWRVCEGSVNEKYVNENRAGME